ncbi:MAG TPA: transposase [Gammaproteobacteria bacterium]
MSRLPRICIPGLPFHVVQRGNDRARVFFEDDDYHAYLHLLIGMSERYATEIHAYVLMTNHIHLLVSSQRRDGVSRTMQQVSSGYARRINDRYERTGTLWESRFKSSPIDSDHYGLTCYRYIELNPVRAGIVRSPAEYRWSSYRENAGLSAMSVVRPHACYAALGVSGKERSRQYRQIVHEHLSERALADIREGTSKGLPVGAGAFKREIEARLGEPLGSRQRGRPRKKGSDPFFGCS